MRWKGLLNLGLGVGVSLASGGMLAAQVPTLPGATPPVAAFATPTVVTNPTVSVPATTAVQKGDPTPAPAGTLGVPVSDAGSVAAPPSFFDNCLTCFGGKCADDGTSPLGPTGFPAVGIMQDFIFGKDNKDTWGIKIGGWLEADYTYRSGGSGLAFNPTGGPGIAPVMNRFGDEATMREIGLMITKDLDRTTWSWGFNIIALAGADAAFLAPTKGWYAQNDPRFGFDFTDLNVTAHLPILTDGGVDVKIGRQTTILGPMGALSWQRPFGSSDYGWYNMEEGRYTGGSAIWHVNKQLDIYTGIEFGWGTFYSVKSASPQYIGNVSYWLDEDAKDTKVWSTVLTGPTGDNSNKNTTVAEFGGQKNWNRYMYTIVDMQITYSLAPVFGGPPPAGYIERAYDFYVYHGVHLNKCWDITGRAEYYYDADGQGYAGGFGIPKTSYYEFTVGPNYHPNKWLEFRPEIRYDGANNPAFGSEANALHRNQLSICADVVIKF